MTGIMETGFIKVGTIMYYFYQKVMLQKEFKKQEIAHFALIQKQEYKSLDIKYKIIKDIILMKNQGMPLKVKEQ